MARPKKRTVEPTSNTLLDAIKFVGQVCKDAGPINETHLYLGQHWATAFNGVIAAGIPITEDIHCCPQSKTIIQALSKCNEQIAFTQIKNQLSIKSGKFKAIIPCIDPTLLHLAIPDPAIADIDDKFKAGLECVGSLPNENAQNIYGASILMNGRSLLATLAGKMIVEYWHGIDLLPGLALPVAVVKPLIETKTPLIKFGYSSSSVTFYYQDGSWLKSQLYSEQWPDISSVLDRPSNAWPIMPAFWEALAAVAPFSDTGLVYFGTGVLQSHEVASVGAQYELEGIPKGPAFPAKQLALMRPWVKSVDWLMPNGLMAYGDQVRCAIAGVSRPSGIDDDIPF